MKSRAAGHYARKIEREREKQDTKSEMEQLERDTCRERGMERRKHQRNSSQLKRSACQKWTRQAAEGGRQSWMFRVGGSK